MPSDPIQHLRELIERERSWRGGAGHIAECHHEAAQRELADAVDATLPALLAVAEALAKHKASAEKYMDMSDSQKTTMRGRRLGNQAEAEYHAALNALAKLDEVKPS